MITLVHKEYTNPGQLKNAVVHADGNWIGEVRFDAEYGEYIFETNHKAFDAKMFREIADILMALNKIGDIT